MKRAFVSTLAMLLCICTLFGLFLQVPTEASAATSLQDVTARFAGKTISLKSVQNGQYLCADQNLSNTPAMCNRDTVNTWETFTVSSKTSDGWVAFKSSTNGKYLSAINTVQDQPLRASADAIKTWECFRIYQHGQDYYIKAKVNQKFLTVRVDLSGAPVQARASAVSTWERFAIQEISATTEITTTGTSNSSEINTSGYYVTTKNTAIRSSTGKLYSTYCTLQSGSLIKTSGTSGSDFYKVNLNGTTYYVKKSDLKTASTTTKAPIYYSTKQITLKSGPYDKSTSAVTLPGNSLISVVGKVKNSYNNTWLLVSYRDCLFFVYEGNVKKANTVTLQISGSVNKLNVGRTLQLKCKSTPSNLKEITWSSSNPTIATIDSQGNVTPKVAGTCTIQAKIDGVVCASYPLTITYQWPTSGKVTSNFGYRTLYGKQDFHGGIDIGAGKGTPIYAVAAGTVTTSCWNDSYGNYIVITHNDGSKTYYAHCSELLVKKGATVGAGQLIAKVGSTGNSTGNHLHFEIRINGERIDPKTHLE